MLISDSRPSDRDCKLPAARDLITISDFVAFTRRILSETVKTQLAELLNKVLQSRLKEIRFALRMLLLVRGYFAFGAGLLLLLVAFAFGAGLLWCFYSCAHLENSITGTGTFERISGRVSSAVTMRQSLIPNSN